MEQNEFNLVELIKIWLRWKKHIFIICSIAVIGSTIVSLLMPEYFKSTSIFYPYNPKLSDPRTLYVKDINYNIFGENEDIDRIISIANSTSIHKYMIDEFNLIEHYDIAPDSLAFTNSLEEFRDNFTFIKNNEGALEITIIDTEKKLSAKMVKVMTDKINLINIQMVRKNNLKLLSIYEQYTNTQYKEIKTLSDSLLLLREKHQLFVPLSKIIMSGLSDIKSAKGVDEISSLETQINYLNNEYLSAKKNYTQVKSTLDNFDKSLFIVEQAIPAEKKSKPVRWLIVISSLIIAFFLSTLSAVIIDFYRSDIKNLIE